jgi:outer membrane receptor protein involved in Fe transport
MRKFYLLTFVLLLIPFVAVAQYGIVKGVIIDTETNESLAGVNVTVSGTSMGAATDQDGYFSIENIAQGEVTLVFEYIGYEKLEKAVTISEEPTTLEILLQPSVLTAQTIVVEVNRAEDRKTPISFTTVEKEELLDKYATQDVPDLLKDISGVFTSSSGLGESEILIRGFDAEHVQVLINGIPENDPESQTVYWSNWTGLSGNASSIQVQKGVGASLLGSGAFGGSVNITTDYFSATPRFVFRGSMVNYNTKGGYLGTDGSATGLGGSQNANPTNQLWAVDYTTGLLYGGKLNIFLRYERKSGDAYILNTNYNGHSFYLGVQSILGNHLLTFAAHGAPQRHLQARTLQDIGLLGSLGREYNRNNHPYQENYFYKPQFELHDDWTISKNQYLKINAFLTTGDGGGRYLRNDAFNVFNGEVGFKPVTSDDDAKYFGRHALFAYDVTGDVLSGFNPADSSFIYNGDTSFVSQSSNLITSSFNHSWRNDSQNHHVQYGLNAAYDHEINQIFAFVFGGEVRSWDADHYAESLDFRKLNLQTDGVRTVEEVQRRYDYNGSVFNLSGFGRLLVAPIQELTIMLDGQYARYSSKVEENQMRMWDFGASKWTNTYYYATKSLKNEDGSFVYQDSDYERTFTFFMPKFGANYNATQHLNVYGNYSISKKEPKVGDWYDRDDGPGALQSGEKELEAETLSNIELGVGYKTDDYFIKANFYSMDFDDKIESVTNQSGDRETINAGNSKHQGVEIEAGGRFSQWDAMISGTYCSNEWQSMNVQEIFGQPAEDVVGKVVPFSPKQMLHAKLGYNIGNFRIGLGTTYWDEYYTNYTNELDDGSKAKLPSFFELNAVISYKMNINGADVDLRLNLNNLTNKDDNYQTAAWTRDFNRNDDLSGVYHTYVIQSPLFQTMFTAQVSL